jgi:hypothetical protein
MDGAHITQYKVRDAIDSGAVAGCTMSALEQVGAAPIATTKKPQEMVLLLQPTTTPGALSLLSA